MTPIAFAFVSVVAVSAISLIGLLTLSMSESRLRRVTTFFVSFAAGALLGDTFIHLVPEIFVRAQPPATLRASLLILAGIVLFFVVEKLLRHEHGILHRHHHDHDQIARPELAAVNLLGDAIHNYIDGLLIGASWLASPELGITTTIAVLLHEVPQEISDFAILVHSGLSVRQATFLNFASAAVAILGTTTAIVLGTVAHRHVTAVLVPITAGGFVYIAAANLIPELQHDRSLRALSTQTLLMMLGVGVMALLIFVE